MELKISPKAKEDGILNARQLGKLIYLVVDIESPNLEKVLTYSKKEWICLRKNGIRTDSGTENPSENGREDPSEGIEIQTNVVGENKN